MELNLIKGKYERPAVAVSREEFCIKTQWSEKRNSWIVEIQAPNEFWNFILTPHLSTVPQTTAEYKKS